MNGTMEIRQQVRLSKWGARVRECKESGLSMYDLNYQINIAQNAL